MTEEQQTKFNILNEAWSELKPHVEDKDTYKAIMGALFKKYCKKRQNQFSDTWWKEVIDEFTDFPNKYWETPYFDFAGELAMGFLNFWEHTYKLNTEEMYRQDINIAFEKESERIGKGQKRIPA